jgi:hypothetical protein
MIMNLKAAMAGLKILQWNSVGEAKKKLENLPPKQSQTFPRFKPITSPEKVTSTTVVITHSIEKPLFSDASSQY